MYALTFFPAHIRGPAEKTKLYFARSLDAGSSLLSGMKWSGSGNMLASWWWLTKQEPEKWLKVFNQGEMLSQSIRIAPQEMKLTAYPSGNVMIDNHWAFFWAHSWKTARHSRERPRSLLDDIHGYGRFSLRACLCLVNFAFMLATLSTLLSSPTSNTLLDDAVLVGHDSN